MLKKDDFVNPFTLSGNWFKANFHTHTTISDGELTPTEQVARYAANGYDVINLSDHRLTNDISEIPVRDDILVISGMECHPRCPGENRELYHIVAVNIPHGFQYDEDDAGHCVRQIRQAGGEAILAHPYWNGHDFAEMKALDEVLALEVYNSSCDWSGRPNSESEWAMCLQKEYYLGGLAADDSHWREKRDFFMGWTWLKMELLTVENVLRSLRTGAYYASCGPVIRDFRVEDEQVKLTCSEVEKINFLANGCGQGFREWAPAGQSITGAELPRQRCKTWPFVRAIVTDAFGKKAWTNPIFLQ